MKKIQNGRKQDVKKGKSSDKDSQLTPKKQIVSSYKEYSAEVPIDLPRIVLAQVEASDDDY